MVLIVCRSSWTWERKYCCSTMTGTPSKFWCSWCKENRDKYRLIRHFSITLIWSGETGAILRFIQLYLFLGFILDSVWLNPTYPIYAVHLHSSLDRWSALLYNGIYRYVFWWTLYKIIIKVASVLYWREECVHGDKVSLPSPARRYRPCGHARGLSVRGWYLNLRALVFRDKRE